MSKRIIVTVSTDLVTDNRVKRSCQLMHEMGFEVILVGRKLKNSPPIQRPYKCKRYRLLAEKGPFFYAFLNIRMFLYILFKRKDILFVNDLDTLLGVQLANSIRKRPLIYDSHEYFTAMPELESRPKIQKIWKRIENRCFPRIKNEIITVNESIAHRYEQEYKKKLHVIRNVTDAEQIPNIFKTRKELKMDENKFTLLIQGSGINIDRGGEEAIKAMHLLDSDFVLYIIGSGTAIPELKKLASKEKLDEKVIFIDRLPYADLLQYTYNADVGLSLDKPTNYNYEHSLPNKLFDFIHCHTPIIASKLPEVSKIIESYQVGLSIDKTDPESIAKMALEMKENSEIYQQFKTNCAEIKSELCWEKEKEVLKNILAKYQ
jgi:glycosyltransferase involved in cell wall biosynthesis